jgi:hypothetical protein
VLGHKQNTVSVSIIVLWPQVSFLYGMSREQVITSSPRPVTSTCRWFCRHRPKACGRGRGVTAALFSAAPEACHPLTQHGWLLGIASHLLGCWPPTLLAGWLVVLSL